MCGDSGFSVFTKSINASDVEDLTHMLSGNDSHAFAIRNLLVENKDIQRLAARPEILGIAKDVIGPEARAVKATYFNKSDRANWIVPPHQDVTIAVKAKIETAGFSTWTEKDGVANVQPPADILEQMIALRIHLDDCDENNGALKLWPGSHLHGKLTDNGITNWLLHNEPTICAVKAGDIMTMRPLLIHASSKAIMPTNRRVIHIEYAGCSLPGNLEWLSDIR